MIDTNSWNQIGVQRASTCGETSLVSTFQNRITDKKRTLPMGERERHSPIATGITVFCLTQHASEERREGIIYKKWWLLGILRALEGIFWKGGHV